MLFKKKKKKVLLRTGHWNFLCILCCLHSVGCFEFHTQFEQTWIQNNNNNNIFTHGKLYVLGLLNMLLNVCVKAHAYIYKVFLIEFLIKIQDPLLLNQRWPTLPEMTFVWSAWSQKNYWWPIYEQNYNYYSFLIITQCSSSLTVTQETELDTKEREILFSQHALIQAA